MGRRFPLTAVLLLSVLMSGGLLTACSGSSGETFTAVFSSAQGIFPGNAVEILGVKEGTVLSVANAGSVVDVTMSLPAGKSLPMGVHAALVSPQLLGEPNVDLFPGYTKGATLPPGSTIPLKRTSVPVSIDQLLKQLKTFLTGIDTTSASALIRNLAADFKGEGKKLNRLISSAAGTLGTLASKGDQLGTLEGNVARITAAMDGHLSSIENLIVAYDKVSQMVSAHSRQLDDAITQLQNATLSVADLLSSRLQPLRQDVAAVTTVGRTLDRNISALDETLASSVQLFAAGHRAYDAKYRWINLNLAVPPGRTGAFVVGLARDRLAGVCRRIAAHHAQGLDVTELAALQKCGDPSSGYFGPLLDAILSSLPANGTGPVDFQQLFSAGLQGIPGMTPRQQAAIAPAGGGS